MLNRSASLAMSTSILEALPGKLDIKRHSTSIFYFSTSRNNSVFSNSSRGSSMSDSPSLNGSINKGRVRRPSGNKVRYI